MTSKRDLRRDLAAMERRALNAERALDGCRLTTDAVRANVVELEKELTRERSMHIAAVSALLACEKAEPWTPLSSFDGLAGWSTAGVGDVLPTVESGAARFRLTGDQDRSELILGGDGGNSTATVLKLAEGSEGTYAFIFQINEMIYGGPGCHNLLMQLKSDGEGSPNFGLQLWDYQGKKGLWSHSAAMGGDRFLAPVSEGDWHRVEIDFLASRAWKGRYTIRLDGGEVDRAEGVNIIRPDRSYIYIKQGIYRNGTARPGTSEVLVAAAGLIA